MDCNKQLEWYKSVKETQGSVEDTTFGKMTNILAYGWYKVGSQSTQTVHSIQDMIHLKLENTGKQLPKTNYSLDDLRDLESKLVLITGSKAEKRKEVDQFLNVSGRGIFCHTAHQQNYPVLNSSVVGLNSLILTQALYLISSIPFYFSLTYPSPPPHTHTHLYIFRLSTVSVELQTCY